MLVSFWEMKMSLVLVCETGEMSSSLTIELFMFQGSYGIVKLAVNHDDQGQYVSFVTFCSFKKSNFFLVFFSFFFLQRNDLRSICYLFSKHQSSTFPIFFQAMKILSKKKLKRKGGIFGKLFTKQNQELFSRKYDEALAFDLLWHLNTTTN